ncbi:ABC transporter ATP-binding protein [Arsenicicoccus bolidensis]|uniref:ABC transporter ATP-binding protein/permease n=1 Tax=Arsenicicoccus bolidensis TaxID=229480 RepID=A0ABS9Q3R2_9MICO|nr:ABC transporter ATP-binding protein [Arsenicicoccus bolidensis]MCG7322514.1 ABC transporter ATP-binding protein/permease [Arsenicicoccus bolidensis]
MSGPGMGNWQMMRSLTKDSSVKDRRLAPGTARRVVGYADRYRGQIAVFLVLILIDAALVVATPLLLGKVVDDGVIPGNRSVVITIAIVLAGLALVDAALALVQRWFSARIGEGLIYDLRTQVFGHVLDQPIAFFTRAQTGALVTRLNSDVIGAQSAFTSILSTTVSNLVSVVFIVAAMASKSWVLTLAALALLPVFMLPARVMGRRLAGLQHESMGLNAELGTRMTERFNVAGALLVKLFGRPRDESQQYADRAAQVRDIGIRIALNRTFFFTGLTFVAALATAVVYGIGGLMAIDGSLSVGALLALAALLSRLYGPLTQLSNVRVDVMTALVSFERVFEVLDLQPLVREVEHPRAIPDEAVSVELDDVVFRYPSADEISLESLEQGGATGDRASGGPVLQGVSFRVEPGQLVALVGPSGAGKTTITSLVARLYDPTTGTVRIGGIDLREASFDSLHDVVGMVTQEAHLFHDTIRANLDYARPGVTDDDVWRALRAAQVASLVESLPEGLDTVVGDRGHRLSGGEKQRLAIARLLLKGPGLVILDEATAHLDSESEAAVQRALDSALHGRTAMVIAHRLSTVRGADLILVVDGGRIVQQGTHAELLARGGLYAELYRTQFTD